MSTCKSKHHTTFNDQENILATKELFWNSQSTPQHIERSKEEEDSFDFFVYSKNNVMIFYKISFQRKMENG